MTRAEARRVYIDQTWRSDPESRAPAGAGETTLKRAARVAAESLGHFLRRFESIVGGEKGWRARCVLCDAMAVILPHMFARDGRGIGGTALADQCRRNVFPSVEAWRASRPVLDFGGDDS